ncbi:SDR family NAD(P)-dependent oxidoreductase [Sorangium sp. So ce341]|uniref:SDR family NAD(P)-dependent oxidoreductase n=1 Tax=Sorangium sp. So ce341 TaxID=3133302 RepID=UPI003F610D0E
MGSALAHRAIPLQSAYCAAKHAIKGFTESLRCELFHDRSGVRVTQVDVDDHRRLPPEQYRPPRLARRSMWTLVGSETRRLAASARRAGDDTR